MEPTWPQSDSITSGPLLLQPAFVWVSRRLENGEICVWRSESAAKAAFASGAYGLPFKKEVRDAHEQ